MRRIYNKILPNLIVLIISNLILLKLVSFRIHNLITSNEKIKMSMLFFCVIVLIYSLSILDYCIRRIVNRSICLTIDNEFIALYDEERIIMFKDIEKIELVTIEKEKVIYIKTEDDEYFLIKDKNILYNISKLFIELNKRKDIALTNI